MKETNAFGASRAAMTDAVRPTAMAGLITEIENLSLLAQTAGDRLFGVLSRFDPAPEAATTASKEGIRAVPAGSLGAVRERLSTLRAQMERVSELTERAEHIA